MSFVSLKNQKVTTETLGKVTSTATAVGSRTMGRSLNFINTPGNPFVRPENIKGSSGRVRVYHEGIHNYLVDAESKREKSYFQVAEYNGNLIIFDSTNHIELSDKGNVRPSTGKSVTRNPLKEGETKNNDKFKIDLAGSINHFYKHFPELGSMEYGNRGVIKVTFSDMITEVFTDAEGNEVFDGDSINYWVAESVTQLAAPKKRKASGTDTVVIGVAEVDEDIEEEIEEIEEIEEDVVEF